MKSGLVLAAALLIISPGSAQSVRSGVEAWQKGDHAAAVSAWTPLAASGDADAAFNLAQAYRLGKGVATDLAKAKILLEQAARAGHIDAATTLGILLFQNGDRSGSMRWLRTAADAGEPRALLLFGTALYNGDGIAPDPVKAYALVSRAAAQGLAAARATLDDLDRAMPLDQRRKGLALATTLAAPKLAPQTAPRPTLAPATRRSPPPPALLATPGKWRIQLGAFGERSSAQALFAKLRPRLGSRQPHYIPAGKVIRLQVGPFATRAAAAATCASLGGQACFPVAAP